MAFDFGDILKLREESMASARDFMVRAREEVGRNWETAQALADELREELHDKAQDFREYLESENFERDLDRLAMRLKMDEARYPAGPDDDRAARVRAKSKAILAHARGQIAEAAETGGAFGILSRRPRVIVAVAAVCGGIKSAGILYETYQVFMPARRRRGLHVVD